VPQLIREGKLALGEPQTERVTRLVEGKGFATDARPGDVVSVHWGWACEVLDERQRRALERYTQHHIRLANETI